MPGLSGSATATGNGVRVLTGRVVVVAENVCLSVGGTTASNDVSGEISIPLTK